MAHMVAIKYKGGSVCLIVDTSWSGSIDFMIFRLAKLFKKSDPPNAL